MAGRKLTEAKLYRLWRKGKRQSGRHRRFPSFEDVTYWEHRLGLPSNAFQAFLDGWSFGVTNNPRYAFENNDYLVGAR